MFKEWREGRRGEVGDVVRESEPGTCDISEAVAQHPSIPGPVPVTYLPTSPLAHQSIYTVIQSIELQTSGTVL